MKANERFPKTYLSTEDFAQPRMVTISHCVEMEVGTEEQPAKKPVLFFQGVEKGWPLNQLNWTTIETLTGQDDDNNWANYQNEIYKPQTPSRGKMVD